MRRGGTCRRCTGLGLRLIWGCEQGQKLLPIVLTAGQLGDSPQFIPVLSGIRAPRLGGGRPRTRPDHVLADKTHTSTANRAHLRRRGIKATIPSKADQDAHRKAKGSKGGRPPAFTPRPINSAMRWSAASTGSNATAPRSTMALTYFDTGPKRPSGSPSRPL
ncbi:transposase [Amycolatopsis sp. NPDC051128]|uniref:transposase n=1 Tax=Amycolatopsis sp. NPDC051128 TaxID=3155412 RepID=UPI003444991C